MLNIVRNNRGGILSINWFEKGDIIVFDRNIGGYSDCYFKIKSFLEIDNDIFVETSESHSIINANDFFSIGYRKPTIDELKYMK